MTEFFRDSDSFKKLSKNVFPEFVKNRPPGSAIRLWIPGCSTGQEAYSLAIVLVYFLEQIGKSFPLQIFATDIREQVLHVARAGFYSEQSVGSLSKERLTLFFEKAEGGYRIRKRIRDLCIFSKHDMTSGSPFGKLDLISCRNLMIYFSANLQRRVLPLLHYALKPSGFLWLGKSENPGDSSRLFRLVEKTHKIYAKINIATPVHFWIPPKDPQRGNTDTTGKCGLEPKSRFSKRRRSVGFAQVCAT